MSKVKLPKDEQDLLNAVESGQFESTLTNDRKKALEAAAANTFKKDKRINLHKYISGSLRDITANKKRSSDV